MMDKDALRRMIEGDAATDDRFLSFGALAFELQQIVDAGHEGDATQMHQAVEKLRAWRAEFDQHFAEIAASVADFGALDELMGGTK